MPGLQDCISKKRCGPPSPFRGARTVASAMSSATGSQAGALLETGVAANSQDNQASRSRAMTRKGSGPTRAKVSPPLGELQENPVVVP